MTVRLAFEANVHACPRCLDEDGVRVEALVRMIPRAAVVNGELVGDEYWCCTRCQRPLYMVRSPRRAVRGKAAARTPKPVR